VRQRYVPRGQPHFLIDNLDQDELWAEYARGLSSKWDASLGVRGDRFEAYGRTVKRAGFPAVIVHETDPTLRYDRFEPRAQVHFRPNGKVVLGFAVGKGAAGPTPTFTETCCGAKYQRSLHLRPEDSWSYQASAEFHPTPDMRVSARLFRTDFEDYQQKVVYRSDSYIAYYTRKNIPEARVQGIDIVHDMRFKDDMFNVGWTWTISDSEGSDVYATDEFNEIVTEFRGQTGPFLVAEDGDPLAFIAKHSGSAYLRYKDVARGTSINFNWSYQGSLRHFQLSDLERTEADPWAYLESDAYWTADIDFEQRIGQKGWSVYGGVRGINNYVQSDLGDLDRIYDWGPIQGRTGFVGMKFSR
jgi:outer membrane receptor protein involved in Fe transport